jgi:hypothetical protein
MFLPSLAAELPGGWTVAESLTLASPSGTEVRVRLDRAPDGLDSSALADRMVDHARTEVHARDVEATTRALVGGYSAEERRFRCEVDGVFSVGHVVGLVESGLALTVTSAWPAADDAGGIDLETAVAGVRVLRLPTRVQISTSGSGEPTTPARRERRPVAPADWAPLLAAWRDSALAHAEPRERTRWAPSELAVVAAVLSSPSFPTIGPAYLNAMPEPALTATVEAVSRSFIARDLVSSGKDGTTVLADHVRDVMEVAVDPDLSILVEQLGPAAEAVFWFGVRPDRAVQISVLPDETRECAALEPAEVFGQSLTLANVVNGTAAASPETRLVSFDELASGDAKVAAINRITTAWRDGGHIVGGGFTFAVGLDDSLWDAEPDESSTGWSLRRTDVQGVRSKFFELLPGV